MKPKDLRPLLDEVLPEAEAKGGPRCAEVLGMLREERARRVQRRVLGVMAVVVLGLAVWMQGQLDRQVPEQRAEVIVIPVAVPVVKKEKPVLAEVKLINDEELLELLGDVPSALLEWPNGERTLLIVEHQRGEF